MYACNICNKEFDSKLALGGHKSSHSRGADFNKKKTIHCLNCDKPHIVLKKSSQKYCNRECMHEHRIKIRKLRESKMFVGSDGQQWDITVAEYIRLKNIDADCEICGIKNSHKLNGKTTGMAMDHNHETGRFRGRLCSSCNRNLGWFERNKESIEKYLS